MRDKWIRSALFITFVGMSSFAFPARAQNFSAWSAPTNLNAIVLSNGTHCLAVVNSASDDSHPTISKDGLSLFFSSTRAGGFGGYDLWVTERDSLDDCWNAPKNLGPVVNSSSEDFTPNLTTDGHWLFFDSKRTTGSCNKGTVAELWVTHRQDSGDDFGWEPPINLGCAINAAGAEDAGPDLFEDEFGNLFLYFTRSLVPNSSANAFIYVSTCPADLATCNMQGLWESGIRVVALNPNMTLGGDTRMAVRRRDGLEMILSSGRTGSLAGQNLWVSTRATTQDQNWLPPVPINCEWQQNVTAILNLMPPPLPCPSWAPIDPPETVVFVNSLASARGPALSWDGTDLYFSSTRMDLPGFAGGRDLYVSKRTYITSTVLNSSANPSVFGQSVAFTATVSSAADGPPTGTVIFSDGSTNLGTSTLASGQATFSTSSLSIGPHSIEGQYGGDRISSASSGNLTQNVEYGICPLYDQTRSVHSGATFPIKLQLCDINGNDLSSSAIVVHAVSVTAVSGFSGTPDSPGNANPDNDFRFDPTLGSSGGYIFNLSTGGLTPGTYSLQFTAGSDPITHSVNFGVN